MLISAEQAGAKTGPLQVCLIMAAVTVRSQQLVPRELLLAPSLHQHLLTAIDASPLLLRVANSPALRLPYPLDARRLQTALEALLHELPIIGGRLRKLSKEERSSHAASHPHLRAAAYCIQLSPAASAAAAAGNEGGSDGSAGATPAVCVSVLLAEARSSNTTAELGLNDALAASCFSLVDRRVQLPPWYQPLDMATLFKGAEPLLKLQLTHTADGGCVLAATMPHLLVDSHSSMLLLRRLSQLYQQAGSGCALSAAAATPLPAVVPAPAATWSKDALLPSRPAGAAAACKDPAALKALSLGLQSADRPSLGSTLKALAAAVSDGLASSKLFPRPTDLTSLLLTIPASDIKRIRALTSVHQADISLNDTLSALVWLTFSHIRQRPLPGVTCSSSSSSSSSRGSNTSTSNPFRRMLSWLSGNSGSSKTAANADQQSKKGPAALGPGTGSSGVLGMAIDLRQNCSDLKQQLPPDYFGNAAWCLHLAATSTVTSSLDSSSTFVAALQAAAASVRAALSSFRGTAACGETVLQLVQAQQAAPARVTVRNLSRLAVEVDAFITSWSFPVHDIDFGAGPAVEFSAVVRPTPPWQAAVLPQLLPKQQAAAPAVQLLLTVPVSAAAALQSSPVLRELVPGAGFGH